MRLLDARGLEVLQDHPSKILVFTVTELGFGNIVNEFVVLINPQQSVGRKAVYRKRACDTNFLFVMVRFVVEILEIGLGGDGSIDPLLPGDALLPPICMNPSNLRGPGVVSLAGDFPFLPGCAERAGLIVHVTVPNVLGIFPKSRRLRRYWRYPSG